MRLEDFFLICFIVGASLSIFSFLAARLHLHLPHKLHLPHFGHSHVPHGGMKLPTKFPSKLSTDVSAGVPHSSMDAGHLSPFNYPTLVIFLAWFGAAGYLSTHYYGYGTILATLASVAGGLIGGSAVYWFMRMIFSFEKPLDQADFEMVGVVGKLTISIRAGAQGTGELTYEQQGTRRSCGARTDDGSALDKGMEVVVTAFDKGIAIVKRWDEFTDM
jgi:membrane protein implicated in regulation of membrane protease activity